MARTKITKKSGGQGLDPKLRLSKVLALHGTAKYQGKIYMKRRRGASHLGETYNKWKECDMKSGKYI
jgi:virulence-associated protein VapD